MAQNYNSRYKPAEVLWMNGEGHLIRAHEQDLLKNQILLHHKWRRLKIKSIYTDISGKWDL
jgi:hypothetical protein